MFIFLGTKNSGRYSYIFYILSFICFASRLGIRKIIEIIIKLSYFIYNQWIVMTSQPSSLAPSSLNNLKIGTIGSPNTTTVFHGDILETNINQSILGQIVFFFHCEKEGTDIKVKIVLGQVTKLESKNLWHEDYALRSVIKRRGRLDYLSGETDIKGMVIKLLGVYQIDADTIKGCPSDEQVYNTIISGQANVNITMSTISTPPVSGTYVYLLNEDLLRVLLSYERGNIIFLGYIYGSTTPAPFRLRHFGREVAP